MSTRCGKSRCSNEFNRPLTRILSPKLFEETRKSDSEAAPRGETPAGADREAGESTCRFVRESGASTTRRWIRETRATARRNEMGMRTANPRCLPSTTRASSSTPASMSSTAMISTSQQVTQILSLQPPIKSCHLISSPDCIRLHGLSHQHAGVIQLSLPRESRTDSHLLSHCSRSNDP